METINLAYTPVWETLADALRRVVAVGSKESEAKRDLCRAMVDEAITIRLLLAADARLNLPELPASVAGLDLPERLLPGDIDWRQSRPTSPGRLQGARIVNLRPYTRHAWRTYWGGRSGRFKCDRLMFQGYSSVRPLQSPPSRRRTCVFENLDQAPKRVESKRQ